MPGVGPALENKLLDAGIADVKQLAAMALEQLTAIEGIGEKTAQKLLESAGVAIAAHDAAEAKAPAESDAPAPTAAGDAPAEPAPAQPEEAEPSTDTASEEPKADEAPDTKEGAE